MLADLASFRTYLSLSQSDTTEYAYDTPLLMAADRIFKLWVKRDLETTNYTEYLTGENQVKLAIPQRPIIAPVFTGTLANGLATFTGMTCLNAYPVATNGTPLSGTQNLIVGMPAAIVASSGANVQLSILPISTFIQSINSQSQVTLTNNATASGTYNLVFGIDVYLDQQGRGGDAANAFAAATQLMLGSSYVLQRSGSREGNSKSGQIQRLGGGGNILDGGFGWYGGFQGGGIIGGSPLQSLTTSPLPRWPGSIGQNIKVSYTAGLGAGCTPTTSLPLLTTIDPAITTAVCAIAAWTRLTSPRGAPLDTNSFNARLAIQQLTAAAETDPALATVVGVARRYREVSW